MKRSYQKVPKEVLRKVIDENENKNTKMSHLMWGGMFLEYLKDVEEEKELSNKFEFKN
jgi:Fe-S cluster assembly scaffold protein SufB